MKARYTLYAILTLLSLGALPLTTSASTICLDNSASSTNTYEGQHIHYYNFDPAGWVSSWGLVYDNTEICDVNTITIPIVVNALRTSQMPLSDTFRMYVYAVSTSTDDLYDLKYISNEITLDLSAGEHSVDFRFDTTWTTVPARKYAFIIRPTTEWTASTSTWDRFSWGYQLDTDDPNAYGVIYNNNSVYCGYGSCTYGEPSIWNYDTSGYEPIYTIWFDSNEDFINSDDSLYIDIQAPCESHSSQATNVNETPLCLRNTSSDTYSGNVRWSSSTDTFAQVRTVISDVETDDILDSGTSAFQAQGDRTWSFDFSYGSSTLILIQACVEPGGAMTLWTEPDWIKCVNMYTCANQVWTEEACYGALRAEGVPLYYGDGETSWFKAQLDNMFGKVKKSFPFYYGFALYDAYNYYRTVPTDFTVSFDVSAFDSNTGLDPEIPANEDTPSWNISAMARHAKTLSPGLFTAIDTILWGFFGLFLVFRIFSGTWTHGLEAGSTEAKARVLENRRDQRLEAVAQRRSLWSRR